MPVLLGSTARTVSLLTLGAGIVLASAVAAEPTVLFGNTLQVAREDGTTARFFVNADGSYSSTSSTGDSTAGSWHELPHSLCLDQSTPTLAPDLCAPWTSHAVGDTWTAARGDGSTSQLTIVSGR